MQLFIIPTPPDSEYITLNNQGIVHQMNRVLRMKLGSQCMLQWYDTSGVRRGLYEVVQVDKKEVKLRDKSVELRAKNNEKQVILAIALPNKWSKAELIVQKLAEIGVSKLIWFPAQRSQYQEIPEKKLQRMKDIAKEATEQSWGWEMMEIDYVPTLENNVFEEEGKFWVCDREKREEGRVESGECRVQSTEFGNQKSEIGNQNIKKGERVCHPERSEGSRKLSAIQGTSQDSVLCTEGQVIILVGPEGGRGPQDYEVFRQHTYSIMDLGKTILRMETAAIISAWRGKNEL